jgi:hypothetical protein
MPRTRQILSRVTFLFFKNREIPSQEPIFSQLKTSIKKTIELLSQNDFRCFEAWKARMGLCVASDGSYYEGEYCEDKLIW